LSKQQLAKKFFRQIGSPGTIDEKVEKLAIEHLSYVNVQTDKALMNLAERLKPASIEELLWLIEADVSGRPPLPKGLPEIAKKIKERSKELGVYYQGPNPLITSSLLLQHSVLETGSRMDAIIKQAYVEQLKGSFSDVAGGISWVRSQTFKPLLNGRIIIDAGILPPSNKVGKLLEAAELAQIQGLFVDHNGALTWAKNWVDAQT